MSLLRPRTRSTWASLSLLVYIGIACDGSPAAPLPGSQGPTVTIVSPTLADTADLYAPVTLSATATDPQDGTNCCASNVRWEHFIGNALIGFGQMITRDSFDLGTSVAEAIMTDLDGNTGSSFRNVYVFLRTTELLYDVEEDSIFRTTGDRQTRVAFGSNGAWSPNGQRFAFVAFDGTTDDEIWIADADGGNLQQVTDNAVDDDSPAWSPDGTRLVYVGDALGNPELEIIVLGSGGVTPLAASSATDAEPDWSGSVILFESDRDPDGDVEIWSVNDDGSTAPVQLTFNTADDRDPHWTADGTQIVFSSNRTGNSDIFIMNADGTSQVNLTNHPARDREGSMSPDGLKLVFVSDRGPFASDDLWFIRPDGSQPVTWRSGPSANVGHPRWRP